MGDYGGFGGLLEISEKNRTDPDHRKRFLYDLYSIEFQTTNSVVAKLIVGGIWLAASVLYLTYSLLHCCCGGHSKLKVE